MYVYRGLILRQRLKEAIQMVEFLDGILDSGMTQVYVEAILSTLTITLVSTVIAYIIGIPLGLRR